MTKADEPEGSGGRKRAKKSKGRADPPREEISVSQDAQRMQISKESR